MPINMVAKILALVVTLSASTASSRVVFAQDYPYPVQNPLIATLLAGVNTSSFPFEVLSYELRPDRRKVPLLEKRHRLNLALFRQKGSAPLALVVSGFGGGGLSGSSLKMAEVLHSFGFHVVTLPNPITWQYVLSVSSSTKLGYLPNDVKEYYLFVRTILSWLRLREGLNFDEVNLVGLSYGGLLSGFLNEIDRAQNKVGFKSVVLINPAIDMAHAMRTLDGFFDLGRNYSLSDRDLIRGYVIGVGEHLLNQGASPAALQGALRSFQLSNRQVRWLIGDTFRSDFADFLFAAEQIAPLGLLKSEVSHGVRTPRQNEAKSVSFSSYIEKVLLPPLQAETGLSKEGLLYQSGLYSLLDMIRDDQRVFVMTNADDFLLQPGDIKLLADAAKDRFYLYPFGGHLGNLWMPINHFDLQKILLGSQRPASTP